MGGEVLGAQIQQAEQGVPHRVREIDFALALDHDDGKSRGCKPQAPARTFE